MRGRAPPKGVEAPPQPPRLLDIACFERQQVIDETPMSLVVRLRGRRPGLPGAAAGKRVRTGSAIHRDGGHLNEVRMLQKLADHPGIVRLYGICDSESEFWTILELCNGGRLEVWLQRRPQTAGEVARQLLDAMIALHGSLICHLDVKPDNVLLTDAGRVRLCDFVTACQLDSPEQRLRGLCGTEGFRAPEIAAGGADGYSGLLVDIFSLGRTLQAVLKAEPTWRELTRVCREMTVQEPGRRRSLEEAHASLFGRPPAGGGNRSPAAIPAPLLDFGALESVGCRTAQLSQGAGGPRTSAGASAAGRAAAPAAAGRGGATGATTAAMTGRGGEDTGGSAAHASAPHASGAVALKPLKPLGRDVLPRPAAPVTCGRTTCVTIGACLCRDVPTPVGDVLPHLRPGARGRGRGGGGSLTP
eukprot:TRINITY_DN12239_c0_g1_i1.p2 TRINITY_DN12239_c0_g1~~TRINITY_DN12239_c0_g1_i1.p2  ORF type:complete len:416 (+),score=67.27 TRINITY_DN12239_c0_g1_i1:98-1345(+)